MPVTVNVVLKTFLSILRPFKKKGPGSRPKINIMPFHQPVHIRYLHLENVNDHEFEEIQYEVSSWGVKQVDGMRQEVHKKHILGHWVAFNTLKTLGVTLEELKQVALNRFGKPFIPSHRAFFNISHSGAMIICAASEQGEIGIDVEEIKAVDWIQYKDCFSMMEWRNISFANDSNRLLLELWTKKESLLKADGRGLQVPLTDVILEEKYGLIKGEEKKWYFKPIPLNGYVCNVCAEFQIETVSVE
jgi:phosphopantetheinyl transferase